VQILVLMATCNVVLGKTVLRSFASHGVKAEAEKQKKAWSDLKTELEDEEEQLDYVLYLVRKGIIKQMMSKTMNRPIAKSARHYNHNFPNKLRTLAMRITNPDTMTTSFLKALQKKDAEAIWALFEGATCYTVKDKVVQRDEASWTDHTKDRIVALGNVLQYVEVDEDNVTVNLTHFIFGLVTESGKKPDTDEPATHIKFYRRPGDPLVPIPTIALTAAKEGRLTIANPSKENEAAIQSRAPEFINIKIVETIYASVNKKIDHMERLQEAADQLKRDQQEDLVGQFLKKQDVQNKFSQAVRVKKEGEAEREDVAAEQSDEAAEEEGEEVGEVASSSSSKKTRASPKAQRGAGIKPAKVWDWKTAVGAANATAGRGQGRKRMRKIGSNPTFSSRKRTAMKSAVVVT
jgi:hypothetical protein